MGMRLSVLDQSPIPEGATGAKALANTVDLARHAEALGYERYWLAEHHATPALACAAPEVLIAAVAQNTESIRVGSGGVMLPHYSPLKVAEVFSTLAGLHPERIDLGLGRAPGTDPMTMLALQRDRRHAAPDDFPEQLVELLALLEDRVPQDHLLARHAKLLPGRPERPEPWLLGSSPQSAIWAGELGLPYAFADFINPNGAAIAADYRARFVDSERLPAPRTMVCTIAVCAETAEEAERVASSGRMMFSQLRMGRLIPIPPPDKAMAYLASRARPSESEHRRRAIIGTPDTVRAGLEAVAAEYGADDVMVLTITYEHEARRRSYELIAEEFGLTRSQPRQVDDLLAEARGDLDRLEPAAAHAAMADGAVLVDVRSEVHREQDGVVPGSVFFPRNVLEWRCDPASPWRDERVSDPSRRLIVMCNEGYQSSLAAANLKRLGLEQATDLIGGFQAWRSAGLPVASVD
jgi:luciferase family oxidoreductase group 1